MRKPRAYVITVSDRCSRGEREDLSGPLAVKKLFDAGYENAGYEIIPDGEEILYERLIELADEAKAELILTTGGTGFAERDRSPEATIRASERLAPGVAEAIRAKSMEKTLHAMLSRGVAGIRKKSLIVNLPGSPKAVGEVLDFILKPLLHGLDILSGEGTD